MPIKSYNYVSVTCDKCGISFDEIDKNVLDTMEELRIEGWSGTYRKCYCPECTAEDTKSNNGAEK